jgi:hypothetical protein
MGNDAPSEQICFSPAMSRSQALKTLQWRGEIHHHHRCTTGAF